MFGAVSHEPLPQIFLFHETLRRKFQTPPIEWQTKIKEVAQVHSLISREHWHRSRMRAGLPCEHGIFD
jgi:hypothetical protein